MSRSSSFEPTPESNILAEVWLPVGDWNGRFLGTGNGGSAGSIAYDPLAFGISRGYATANTDMGTSPGAEAVIGNQAAWEDFGYRATHEMTVAAKAIIQQFYNRHARYSYFIGCSTGGQQGLMEAQRYPSDYDGILVGAPANNRTHLHTGFLWNYRAANPSSSSVKLSKEKIDHLSNAVLEPRLIPSNVDTLIEHLTSADHPHFTAQELSVIRDIYSGPINPRTGEQVYTTLPLGSENGPMGIEFQLDQDGRPQFFFPFSWVFGADFDYTQFDFDKDLDKVDEVLAPILNANNP